MYIEKVDGSDQEPGAGHKNTTYKVEKGTSVIYENIEEAVTLTESGVYTVTVTTTDNAGNSAKNTYTIKIDKAVPTLALKHNDESGATYDGTWTKDDLYGEIDIDTSSTGKTVKKYQYSYNGIIWYDISAEQAITSIDYTIDDFNNIQNKPEWIGELTNNGTYYFTVQEDGTLKPNNSGINSKTANSYIEIDLTDYTEASLDIIINATISSESNYDFGYATITDSTTAISFNKNNTYFIKASGPTTTSDYTTTITGGKTYYLHIGYSKDSSQSSNQDTFIINSINVKSETLGKGINFSDYNKTNNKVNFKLKEDIEKEIYVRAVYVSEQDETSKYGDKTTIKIDRTAPVIETAEPIITSKETAKADITVKEEGSGTSGYYISTQENTPTETSTWTSVLSNEFTIEGLSTNSTYYLWVIDNVGNISESKEIVIGNANYLIDDTIYTGTLEQAITAASDGSTIKLLNDYTDISTATFSKNITFNVQNYTLTRSTTITINSGKTVEITGTGKITTESNNVNTITNSGTLTISNSITIENISTSTSYAPIYNSSSSAVININDNVQIIGYYRGIYNYYGTLNVNGGNIEATYSSSSAYGIYNYSSLAKTYINAGEISGYYGIYNYNSSAIVEMTGGKVIGTGAEGIYNLYGTTNIYGGRIEGKTYGIYSYATNKVTIGKQEDELSTTEPAICGASYGIYMSTETYSFNFYNGVIISNTKETAYRGVLNPRTGYMLYTYLDYEVEQRYCTILTPIVENITMEATPTEYTNGDVIVTITYPYIDGTTKQYSEDGVEWKDADQYAQEIVVTENKIIYARTLNESEVITEEQQIEVTNIDKEKPTITISPSQTVYSVTSSTGTADITLTITATDTEVSGLDLMQYAWAAEGEEMAYVDFTNTVTISKTKLAIGQYNLYLNVTDKAGNKADLVQMRYTVKFEEPVCQIGSITYTTIQAAIDACSKEAGDTQTTIEMLKNTDEEFSTYEGQNIILDLKGYTIGSSSLDTPLCTNNATLQLVDSSTEKTGKLESLNGTAVLNNGTFTIGDNSTSIEMEVPTIYGYKVGINNQNVLNFYDGKIQSITPIQGNVTATPEEYGPVSTNYNNGITTVQLGIVTGYEARREWVYYTTVQEAIDATMLYQNNYKDTVTIIKDIQLKNIAEVNSNKNMILDLDGYELTIVSEKDRVINNYGNLEITDSSIEQTGEIKIESESTCYGICNYNNGSVTVKGGTVSSSSSGSYGIYNHSTGTIEVSGGTVSSSTSSRFSYGIYNASTGTIEVSGGTVSSSTSSRFSYGIYNEGTGTIEVSGGTVSSSSSSSSYSYGIYNRSTGNIEVSGGTVSSSSSGFYSYGIYNGSTGTIEVSGGTVSSSGDSSTSYSYGIYNYSTGTIEVSGGTVSSSSSNNWYSYGIYNYSTGTIEVSGGTVSSSSNWYSYGIYNASTGSIVIGTKGDGVISQENPSITATNTSSSYVAYGIYNPSGTLAYYDGAVKGITKAIIGNIEEIEELTELVVDTETIDSKEYETLKLQQTTTNVASVNNVEYDSIQKAVEACGTTESTITILRDSAPGATVIIGENQNITIDLNGYTINNYTELQNKGTLKITDSSEAKTGKIAGLTGIAISNSANIELIEGSISDSGYGIKNTGTLNVSGGNITNNIYGIYNDENGTVIIGDGTISSNTYGAYNYSSSSSIDINGGTISSNEYGIYNYNGTTNVSGTGITSNTYGVYVAGGTTNIKEGSTVQSDIGAYASGGTLNIGETGTMNSSSPIITGETYGLSVTSTGTVYMYDGQIKGKTGATQGYITYTEEGYQIANKTEGEYNIDYLALAGTVSTVAQVNGIDFSNLQSAINSIMGEEAQTITLTNGIISDMTFTISEGQNIILDMNGKTISSDLDVTINNSGNLTIIDSSGNNVAKISSTVGTAIVNSGTLTLGQDDGTVSQDILTIDGTTYGIENAGTLNFYDGTINGASAVNGTITNRPDGYVIRTTTVNSKERYYLST